MIAIPIVAGVAIVTALVARKKKPATFSADAPTMARRRVIYEAALNSKDPIALRKAAKVFREQGCEIEGKLLDQRADICELPAEVTLARREVFRKLMRCQDPSKVRKGADLFGEYGCTGAAADLNRYAQGLEDQATLAAEGMTDAAGN